MISEDLQDILKHYRGRAEHHQLIDHGLAILAVTKPEQASLIRRRYIEDQTHIQVAAAMHISRSRLYVHLANAINELAHIIRQIDTPYYEALATMLRPALFGIDAVSQQLAAAILNTTHFLNLVGLGGSGKTALMHHALHERSLIEAFDDFHYIDLRHAPPSSQQLNNLRSKPTLLIFDYIDPISATTLRELLLPAVMNPSKTVFISRHRVPGTTAFQMPELAKPDALALLKAHTTDVEATPADLERIYSYVGGHAATLLYIVDRITFLPLGAVLKEISQNSPLIRQIYQPYALITLTGPARQLIAELTMLDGQADYDMLSSLSSLSDFAYNQALHELVSHCLVRVSGPLNQHTYTIDKLTRHYLRLSETP